MGQLLLSQAPARHRRSVRSAPAPAQALAALRPLQASLLEGRGEHPGARYAYVAFGATAELWADGTGAWIRRGEQEPERLPGDAWPALTQMLEPSRDVPSDPTFPFAGGWVGVLAHEAAAQFLGVPTAAPSLPARPVLPWAHFRFYPDVLAYDRATGDTQFIANDLGGERTPGPERIRRAQELVSHARPLPAPARARGPSRATLTVDRFEQRVRRLQSLIRDGDCFQVNLTSSHAFPWTGRPSPDSLIALYDTYAGANPGAWGGVHEMPGATILSASPESLVDRTRDRVTLRPIAGTRPRGASQDEDDRLAQELRSDPKERAEHAMLVDLARNDAASVCVPGTVHVPNLAGVERYRHVMHLVSEVTGRPRPDLTVRELLEAVFPGGTVTGAPKRRAVQRIAEVEPGPRGPYTGALGYVGLDGATQWNLLIRTLVATPTHLVAHAGCGIVEGSRPEAESAELAAKARAQVEAATGRATPAPDWLRCGRVDPGPPWSPTIGRARTGRRVLLVDHEDSFVHNLADYCARLGATTIVRSAHLAAADAWTEPPTHVILSPGPGRPEDFPATADHLARAARLGIPVLGVCLGHQALAQMAGAKIVRHTETVHGRASPVVLNVHGRTDPVLGRWTGEVAGRYHSLVAMDLPPDLVPLAGLPDGTCMAIRHADRPWWGLQFHPESLLTEDGLGLLSAFLEVPRRA